MGGHGRDVHDVRHLALVARLVVVRLHDELEDVLGDDALGRVDRVHDLAVPVPDDLGGWIAAP